MQRLAGSELASIGRRVLKEIEIDGLSPAIKKALSQLSEHEATTQIRSGPNSMRVNGYV